MKDSDWTRSTSMPGAQPRKAASTRLCRHHQQEGDDRRQDEGDHLVLGHRRDAGGDGEEGTGHQEGADVARRHDAVVRLAEVERHQPEAHGEDERDGGESPAGEELAISTSWARTGSVIKSSTTPDRRSSAQSRMPMAGIRIRNSQGCQAKERAEVGLATLEEAAGEEGEAGRQREEDQQEDSGERRREVGAELAAEHQRDGAAERFSSRGSPGDTSGGLACR